MQGADVTQPSEYGVAGGALEPMVPQRCFIAKRRAGFQRRAADTFDANYFGNRDTNTEYLRTAAPVSSRAHALALQVVHCFQTSPCRSQQKSELSRLNESVNFKTRPLAK